MTREWYNFFKAKPEAKALREAALAWEAGNARPTDPGPDMRLLAAALAFAEATKCAAHHDRVPAALCTCGGKVEHG